MEKIRIDPGQEVISVVDNHLKKHGITDGAIVSVIGAVDECCISNMPKSDPREDILNEYSEPFEISGSGEIRDGKAHIHIVLGKEGDQTLSGHLHWAKVETWYVHVFVIPIM
ncbi:MAG: DNA-binding protein [Magnetococcales bacterium]|nr:DNA-binding protein [Magnetococcales bacterium]